MTTHTANTSGELAAALAIAVAGDVVELAPGFVEPNNVTLDGFVFSAPGVTVRSQDPARHALYQHRLTVQNCAWLTFENLTFHGVNVTANYDYLCHVLNSTHVTHRYCNFVGRPVDTGHGQTVALGSVGWGKGIVHEGAPDCVVEACYFRHLFKGIAPINRATLSSPRLRISTCFLERVDGDRFALAEDDAIIEDCYAINARSDQTLASPDHVDFLQVGVGDHAGAPEPGPRNMIIRRCIVDQGAGANTQLFFGRSESYEMNATGLATYPAQAIRALTIEDCLGIGQTTHGLSFSTTEGVTFLRNAVFRPAAVNPDPFLANGTTPNGVQVPDLRIVGQSGGSYVVKDCFAGDKALPAGVTAVNCLFQDPTRGEVPFDYNTLITGMPATYDASGAPEEQAHRNVVWPKPGGALALNGIGPAWWHAGAFPGPGPYNTRQQPPRPGDTTLWGLLALATWAAGPPVPPTLTGPSVTARITVS